MVALYRRQQYALIGRKMGQELGYIPLDEPIDLGFFDMQLMEPIDAQAEWLSKVVIEKIDVTGRAVGAVVTLSRVVTSINATIQQRNSFVVEFKATKGMTQFRKIELLFGYRSQEHGLDLSYVGLIDHLERQIDDCIFFSKILITDLLKYGAIRQEQYQKRWKKRPPDIPRISFAEPERLGLIPPDSEYSDWLKGFPPPRVAYSDARQFGKCRYGLRRRCRRCLMWLGWEPMGKGEWKKGRATRRRKIQSIPCRRLRIC